MPAGNPDIEAAVNGDKGAMRRVLSAHDDLHQQTFRRLGVNAHGKKKDGATPLPTPATGTIAVTGVDGRFLVTITPALPNFNRIAAQVPRFNNPRKGDNFRDDDARVGRKINLRMANDVRRAGRLVHELQSATSSLWDNNSNVTTYGPSDKVTYDITDPNATKLWRFRSKFEDSEYTDYVYFVDPSTCGPMPVWSGLPRTSSTAQNNGQGTQTTQPITQSGITTRINIATHTWNMGNQNLTYTSGFVDPGSFGTFYIYALDAKRAGGTVTYLATTALATLTSSDAIVFFGKITTAGGGGGTGGGGGACVVGETLITMADGSARAMRDLRKGDLLMGFDGEAERVELIELIPNMPCFDLATPGGLKLRCSPTHPLWVATFVPAFDLLKGDVLMVWNKVLGMDTLASKTFAGNFTVYRMKLSRTQTYIANGFVSHNLKNT